MRFATLAVLAAALSLSASAQEVTLVALEGQTVDLPGGGTGTLSGLGPPFAAPDGTPGFGVDLASGDDGIWLGGGLVWLNSLAPAGTTLSGRETTIGVGVGGAFGYSPSIDGDDGLWSDNGLVISEPDPAPGGAGFTSFASRPSMAGDGTLYWVGGVSAVQGGSTDFRIFYRSTDRTPGTIEAVLSQQDLLAGRALAALSFDYGLSSLGTQVAVEVRFADTNRDAHVRLSDEAILAEETAPTGGGTTWENLDLVALNDTGRYLTAGDDDAAADEILAVDGAIALREGDVVDGVTLGQNVRGAGINDDGLVVWAWTTDAGNDDEAVFVGDAADLAGSQLFLRTGDLLDVDGDGSDDYVVRDINSSTFSAPQAAFDFPNGTVVYVPLAVSPVAGGAEVDGIFRFDLAGLVSTSNEGTPASASLLGPVAPNPVRGAASVMLTLGAPQAVTVEIVDALGRRVALVHEGSLAAGSHDLPLATAGLAPGTYSVRAVGAGLSGVRPLVVVR